MLQRHEQHDFARSVAIVVASWTDEMFLTAMMQAQGSRNVTVAVERPEPGQIVVTITREVPVQAPALIRSVIGSWLSLTQHDLWQQHPDGSWTATRNAKPKGLAAEGAANIRLTPLSDATTRCDVEISVASRAPMVAAMVETLMLEDSSRLLLEEFAWIDRHA